MEQDEGSRISSIFDRFDEVPTLLRTYNVLFACYIETPVNPRFMIIVDMEGFLYYFDIERDTDSITIARVYRIREYRRFISRMEQNHHVVIRGDEVPVPTD